jgi:hypothetical protein
MCSEAGGGLFVCSVCSSNGRNSVRDYRSWTVTMIWDSYLQYGTLHPSLE